MADKDKVVKAEKQLLDWQIPATLMAGLLSGPNTSHREPDIIADLAVKHAQALIRAVDKANA